MKIKFLLLVATLLLGSQLAAAQISETAPPPDAASWVKSHEAQLPQTTNPFARIYQLVNLSQAAFAAGDTAKARAFANEMLALGEQIKSMAGFGQSGYGQATYTGNTILGLIAFDENNLEKAKEYLLASARTPGSPTLKSFGPGMQLAKNLLDKGERETVMQFFDLCAQFWTSHPEKPEQWKTAVKQGETPDFGANLRAGLDTWQFAP